MTLVCASGCNHKGGLMFEAFAGFWGQPLTIDFVKCEDVTPGARDPLWARWTAETPGGHLFCATSPVSAALTPRAGPPSGARMLRQAPQPRTLCVILQRITFSPA